MENIALFGGSFDPPHIGHEAVVKALLDFKGIDKVVIMPAYLSPFKSSAHASALLRLQWLQKIFSAYHNVWVDDFEVQQKQKVSTIETVQYLLTKYKKIYVVLGADNLASLPKWERYETLKNLVTFIVAHRDAIEIPRNFLDLKIDVDISSTQLRKHVEISKLSNTCAKEIAQYYKEINVN